MEESRIYIKISPEVLLTNNTTVTYSGGTADVFSSMTQMLSGGTNGTSLYTGMTIPIYFSQNFEDIGYYTTWDGDIIQKEILNNFIYSADSADTTFSTICVYNTSDIQFNTFLINQNTVYTINWGDGTPNQTINIFSPLNTCHFYASTGNYQITLTSSNIFGVIETTRNIVIPLNQTPISTNPSGTILFDVTIGSWTATPASYNFIYDYDANNNISDQISIPNYISAPFAITGFTYSRINDLARYGSNPFAPGPVFLGGEQIGSIDCNPCLDGSTGYTIGTGITQSVQFFDLPDGSTIYSGLSSGLISEWLLDEPIVKEEHLLKISMQPEVQSNIFIERGKNSAYERIQRIGEVDNLGDLEKYGYGFFNVVKI